jgi:nucleoside phosphorylase
MRLEPGENVCVVTAVTIEFKTVAKLLREPVAGYESGLKLLRGQSGRSQVTLLQVEMGAPGVATNLREHLAVNRYDYLLVLGLAGGLDPTLQTGDVVIYDVCLNERADAPNALQCDAALAERWRVALEAERLTCVRGAGVQVERIVIEAQRKLELHDRTQALAVDMETYAVLAAAAQTPCAALRVVLDEATSDLPDFNAGVDAQGRLKVWPALWALAARPRATWHFLLALRPSLRNLERVARAVLS